MLDDALSLNERETPFIGPRWFDFAATWLRGHARGVVLFAVAAQVVVLLTMIAVHLYPLLVGEKILLKVQPIDPRDMFRGEYVILTYDINRVPAAGVEGLPGAGNWWFDRWGRDAWLEDRPVYVTLEPDADGKHWHGTKASINRPTTGKYIRGKYAAHSWGAPLRFGIEAYYVQEGHGAALEKLRNAHELTAEIALTSSGVAALSGLHADSAASR